MPFQKGNQQSKVRKKQAGGRPPNDSHQQLQADLSEAWPQPERIAVIRSQAQRALDGDNAAFRALMSYAYGRPGTGDEQKIQEQLEKEVETILQTLEKNLSPSAWHEVQAVLRLG